MFLNQTPELSNFLSVKADLRSTLYVPQPLYLTAMTALGAGETGFDSRQGQGFSSPSPPSQTGSGAHSASY